ncbi:MAG: hypothetical protein RR578_04795, partial [Bacilli bacterium]
ITFFNKLDENELFEIKFFKARCYEVLGEDENAILAYKSYLNTPYFSEDENLEQAAVNQFYINHTIASLLVKLKKYDEASSYFDQILDHMNLEEYLENFDAENGDEVKSFLMDYVETLKQIGKKEKAEEVSEKVMRIFSK